jgi:hypothetical protein
MLFVFLQNRLEIFLRALLSMKTDSIIIGQFACPSSRLAVAKSPSAFAIHSAVAGLVDNFSLFENIT